MSLLALGSMLVPAFPPAAGQWPVGSRSPITVAGPRRIHTGFLVPPSPCRRPSSHPKPASSPPTRESVWLRVHLPEINFGGQSWVRRTADGSVKDLHSAIRDHGSSIRNNSDRTAHVHEKRNHAGRWVCVTRSGGSLHDLRDYHLNDQTRSLKTNRNACG